MHECGYHHPLGCPPRHGTEHRPCRRERRGGANGAGARQRGVEGSVGRQLGRKRSIFHRLVFQPSMAGGEPHHVLVRHRPRARRTRSLARPPWCSPSHANRRRWVPPVEASRRGIRRPEGNVAAGHGGPGEGGNDTRRCGGQGHRSERRSAPRRWESLRDLGDR